MGLSIAVAPTAEPLSLAEAKKHCKITYTDEDGLIAGYILAAREYIENSTHLRLVTQTLDYTIDYTWPCVATRGYYRTRIELPVRPVASVSSVTYIDGAGTTQTLASNLYVLTKDGAVPYIEPAYGVTWPEVRCQPSAITVRFVAGTAVSEVPNPILQALRMLVAHANENREAVSGGTFVEVPMGVEAFISGYRYTRV